MTTLMQTEPAAAAPAVADRSRLDYLDATRAFALALGVVFHASLSFMPVFMGWAVQDVSTSPLVTMFVTVSHSFRMALFFLIAGFLSRLTFHRKGAREFIRSRALRIGVPFVAGWFILKPLIISGWIMGNASMRGTVDIWAGLAGGFETLKALPAGLFAGSHLWFLYYLALITALTLAGRGLVMRMPWGEAWARRAEAIVAWVANSKFALGIFAVPTACALWFMRSWSMDTPDQSLWPHMPALAIYGGFFALGWMANRQQDLLSKLAQVSWQRGAIAAGSIAAALALGGIERDPAHPHRFVAHVGFAFSYALAMWALTFLTLGAFKKWFARPNAAVRYVADSSYWMYLIHLPIVIWLQVAVAEWPLHWALKLALVSSATIGISLITYGLFVRSTFIGWLLNGRRRV